MKRVWISLLSVALAFGAGYCAAADSTDLAVNGTIRPVACEVALANGVYDFGIIGSSTLNASAPTDLVRQRSVMTITCPQAALVAIRAIDNKAGTAANPGSDRFGLGLDASGNKIGTYWIRIQYNAPVINGSAGSLTMSYDNGVTWGANNSPWILHTDPNTLVSFNHATTADGPIPVTSVVTEVEVAPQIAPSSTLDISNKIMLDGSATLELVYL